MTVKTKIAVIYGGKSTEHEISLKSAKGIIHNLNKDKYHINYIYIDKQGVWFNHDAETFQQVSDNPKNPPPAEELILRLGHGKNCLFRYNDQTPLELDLAFPILHGQYGEDGCIQGLLHIAGLPFVGSDVLGSACGMDKDIAKRLLHQANIPNAKYQVIYEHQNRPSYDEVAADLGQIIFVKPACQGSSVGISKVQNADQWKAALDEAFKFDRKVLLEEYIQGREIEISVLGNESPRASIAGEIVPHADFYSYDAKYIDSDGAKLMIPANIPEILLKSLQQMAVKTYQTLGCEGMTRVDFFVRDGQAYINEINTIPGFTPISMYPKLWEASGLGMSDLLDELVHLAISRSEKQAKKQYSFE